MITDPNAVAAAQIRRARDQARPLEDRTPFIIREIGPNGEERHEYVIYADGRIEGFPCHPGGSLAIVNGFSAYVRQRTAEARRLVWDMIRP